MLSAALGGGFAFLKDREDNDLERQFTPRKGPSKAARAFLREHFPCNDSMFSDDRMYDKGNFASLIAVSANNANILANPAFEDIIRLNNKILNITVHNGKLRFNQLCAKANGSRSLSSNRHQLPCIYTQIRLCVSGLCARWCYHRCQQLSHQCSGCKTLLLLR